MTGNRMIVCRMTGNRMIVCRMTGNRMIVCRMTGNRMIACRMTGNRMIVCLRSYPISGLRGHGRMFSENFKYDETGSGFFRDASGKARS